MLYLGDVLVREIQDGHNYQDKAEHHRYEATLIRF